jgi:hypothetical protein
MTRAGMAALAALACAATACGSGAPAAPPASSPAATASPVAAAPSATGTPAAISAADRPACAALFARLQRVTLALSSSSELIAQSEDQTDLSGRIATEQQQLERSARLMDAAVVPGPLAGANRRLVAALRAYAHDFGRAKAPAERGDFQAAVQAMTDKPAVDRMLTAAKSIEDACGA